MGATEEEVRSQPATWRRAAEILPDVAASLPAAGERVLAIGCGTSWFMAQSFAAAREAAGLGQTDASTASELPAARAYDRVLAISRSGTTTEVARALGALDAPSVAISAVAGTPVPARADHALILDFADERSVVQTRFATATLALLRAHLGIDPAPAIADAETALRAPLPVEPPGFDHFVFLGHGWTVGVAHEAALKLREAAQVHTESYPAMEYRHGPVSLAGPSSLVWILGTPDPAVADDVASTGATVVTASLDPLAELVRIHRVALALAAARGLDPDRPRNLTRSVVLP
ncbi:MAG: SIS domain-containing protein [Actinomycetota bacterium]